MLRICHGASPVSINRLSTVFTGAILKCALFVFVVWKMSKKKLLVELYFEEEELLFTAAVQI